ncbi:cold shock domain-containing protein [Enterococcus asini]|nr:cold shock domain-containing protein [Enterococcus asini]MCD5030185.1 cold shock domain-containing protein [Enterococcus asini]
MNGIVKWFNETRGFGFIAGEDGQDYFVHYSEIEMPGFKKLETDQSLKFESEETERGLNAIRVSVM